MTNAIKELTTKLFGSCPWLGILLIAMVPIIELRGALPFALSAAFWGAKVLAWWEAYLFAVVGSTLPALVVIPLLKPLFSWMKKTKGFKKLATALEKRFVRKSSGIQAEIGNEKVERKIFVKKFIGTMAFVAVPLPLTGAWTGSAVAAYLDMKWWQGSLAVLCGNIISGAIMLSICLLFPGAESIIMYAFLGLAVLCIAGSLLWMAFKKKHEITAEESDFAKPDDKKD
jgi:uncharacterized membrane protein